MSADWLRAAARRFARLATNVLVRRPWLWRLFRGPLRRQFNWLAPQWAAMRAPDAFEPFAAALDRLEVPPRRALDLGTGTGAGAFLIARRFPDVEVLGVDFAEAMVVEARREIPAELAERVRFEVADATALPYPDGAFDLVALGNMIPFFDELARIVSPAGTLLLSFSLGRETPIYVPPERIRSELAGRGFAHFAEIAAGSGTAVLARKAGRG
ncbi:MAG: class I SAM-dependent methyltransferase [Gaiellaceae bacterium]